MQRKEDVEDAVFHAWERIIKNIDKIQNTVIFNATGGHTPEWVDMKNQVEKLFKVTIPIAID